MTCRGSVCVRHACCAELNCHLLCSSFHNACCAERHANSKAGQCNIAKQRLMKITSQSLAQSYCMMPYAAHSACCACAMTAVAWEGRPMTVFSFMTSTCNMHGHVSNHMQCSPQGRFLMMRSTHLARRCPFGLPQVRDAGHHNRHLALCARLGVERGNVGRAGNILLLGLSAAAKRSRG